MFDPNTLYVSLKADNGKFLAAENGGGNEGEMDGENPKGLAVANREKPGWEGDWQTFAVIPAGGDQYGLRVTADGVSRFACCEGEGQTGIVVFNRPDLGAWEKFKVWQRPEGVSFEAVCRPGFFIKAFPDGKVTLEQPMVGNENGEMVPSPTPGGYETYSPVVVYGSMGGSVGSDSLSLPVRRTNEGWKDATGFRSIVLCSFFPALYFEKHDPAHVDYVLDLMAENGINGIRGFCYVGGATGWGTHLGDGWRGREVLTTGMTRNGERLEAWPDARDVVIRLGQKLKARNMCWDVTAGDLQTADSEETPYRLSAEALESAGLLDVVCLAEVNEGWQNSRKGNDPTHFARLVSSFAVRGIPWGTSAHPPDSTGPGYTLKQMEYMQRSSSVGCYHVSTGTVDQVRHTFNIRHDEEGVGFRMPLASTEHRGPGPDVSSGAVNNVDWVAFVGVMTVLSGQLFVLHVSQGIRDLPTDHGWAAYAPYMERTTRLCRLIPRGAVTGIGHGGRGGTDPESIGASTRSDGAFYGDKPDATDQFERIDSAAYGTGEVAALFYGGHGHRRAKMDKVSGTFYNAKGEAAFGPGTFEGNMDFGDCGAGLLFVGRRA